MNKRQKEVQQEFLDREKAVLKKLEENYRDALGEINSKIELLMARQDADMQHVIYQVEYQKALKTQVQAILEQLQTNEFETVSEYLSHAYEDGFIGTMYDMQGQGIPLIFPIDQQAVVDAIQADTKLSEGLYTAMGKDITDLKKKITGEISRGLSSGQMYQEITRNIASWARIPKNNAARIARTEAHRIQCKAAMDAQHKAKAKGADVVKQWDSSLDKSTRDSHRDVDGEVRELDEKFSNGLEYPGDPKGRPEEVINCRCALLQRARWALGNNYTKWSPDAPVVYSDDGTVQLAIIEAKDYSDFQKKYKQASERVREGAQKMNDKSTELKKLEKQFSDLTEGYSYDDFINDFGSIEDGFEGSSEAEIMKAKKISEKIKLLRSELNAGKTSVKNTIRTKQESIKMLKNIGIDFNNNSSSSISDEVLSKYVDFITNFENTHSGYFSRNNLQLHSISVVDKINGVSASGIYRGKSNIGKSNDIEIKYSSITSRQSAIFSKSDDPELHVLAHEYGHYIADTLEKNFGITEADTVQSAINKYFDGDIFKSTKDLKDCLSSYGSTSYKEAFAEAFAEAYTCEEPREFARLFKEELEKALASKG